MDSVTVIVALLSAQKEVVQPKVVFATILKVQEEALTVTEEKEWRGLRKTDVK